MDKRKLVDWFLQRQREGFLSECQISVSQLMDIQTNAKEYAKIRDVIRSDLSEIKRRIAAGETITMLSVEYKVDNNNMSRYIKQIEKEIKLI